MFNYYKFNITTFDKQYIPCPAVQTQKLLSSPRFGALKSDMPVCVIFWWSVFFTDTGMTLENEDSSNGGAVETGCSDLYDVIY